MPPRVATSPVYLLEAEELSVSYGSFPALKQLSTKVPQGAIGLVGSNGAGKTSLLRAMLGLVPSYRGRLRVLGMDPRAESLAIRRRVGYVPEGDSFIAGLPAVELVSYAGELAGISPSQSATRAHEVLDLVGLAHDRYQSAETLPTGTRQRLKLAQALVHDPDVLLLDEPTSGLDPAGRVGILNLLKDIPSRLNVSLIMSSHVLADIERLCDWIIAIEDGRCQISGPLETLSSASSLTYDVILLGRGERFATGLVDHGGRVARQGEAFRIRLPEGWSPGRLFQLAKASGAQIRSLRLSNEGLGQALFGE